MKPPLAVQPTMQVGVADCAVAALAMYLGIPYRTVSDAARRLRLNVHHRGMFQTQIVKVAKQFNVTLRESPPGDDPDVALVLVEDKDGRHLALLFQGVLIDPADGQVWDFDTWLATRKWAVVRFLEAL